MRNTIITFFVLGFTSCLPEGLSEKEVALSRGAQVVIEKYKALYEAKHVEIVHLEGENSINALAINIIDARSIPDNMGEKRAISHQIASDIFISLDKEITDKIEIVDFGFKQTQSELLTYTKSSIDRYRFIHSKLKLIPAFSSN